MPITQDKVETRTATVNFKKGWNSFAVYSDLAGTKVYNVMPDATTSSSGVITHTQQIFQDGATYITCVGGRRTSTTAAQDSFSGMINQIRFYSNEVLLADAQARVSFACNNPCPVCPTSISPT